MNGIIKVIVSLVLFIVVITISLSVSLFLIFNRPAEGFPMETVQFEIKRGDSPYAIAGRMKMRGYIRSTTLFKLIVKTAYSGSNVRPRWIELPHKSTTIDLVRAIYNGRAISLKFTVPEGYNVEQIKELLVEKKILSKEELDYFLERPDYLSRIGLEGFGTMEGFLFPDTYTVEKGATAQEVLSTMVTIFYRKLEEIYPAYKRMSPEELFKKVTLASIIEREVRNRDESATVAGVFNNRLNSNMKLQSCATVQFILGKPKARLLERDLLIDNPYNTYLYQGLPPGPICSPGFTALNATFHPAQHDYLFFVVSDPVKGTHHFSRTYSEHLWAQQKYLKAQGYN